MKLRIFFSWQVTTTTTYNKNFILKCIEKATKDLKLTPEFKEVEFIILEGVRGEPGSPPVASKIMDERIPSCDIFIADLSVVNSITSTQKFFRWLSGEKFKPFQNNNVINEHGVASNALGFEKIIGVLNNVYGSPNDNPDNIPFDLRHIRYPIEYKYSEKTSDKEAVQKSLVSDLRSAIKDTAKFALQNQKNKYNPLIVWSEWEKNILTEQPFIPNEKTEEVKELIIAAIKNSGITTRILGLSGLGKTRILLETFRPSALDNGSILLSSRVLYLNCNYHPNADYYSILSKLALDQEDRIVVLDNCPMTVHRQVTAFTKREDNKLSFISLDSNPEEIERDKINGVNYIIIKKEDLISVVDEILKRDFGNIGDENIRKIKEFSQGIPLMAVLLGESVKNGERFIGKLDDKELLDKLLGEKGKDPKNRTILKSCAIFSYFGFDDDLASQVQFIAKNKNITSLDIDDAVVVNDFHEICRHYLKREIFEPRGRFIAMRPFPLAMSLAQEWLEPCTPQRLIDVITGIASLQEPDRKDLSEALAEQMKYLGYNDKAVQIIDKIIGVDSPFDNAEVLNTELGSRLFRSFVEVNPVAVSQNFVRCFSGKTTEQLLEIVDGRRNLVWVLEKLCFDRRTFSDSVKILYAFAVAENESWANNATGQFLHLFNVILSGTEATLKDKWEVIEWGINHKDERFYNLAIGAMKRGLNYSHFSRMSGAEKQGNKTLQDNQPTWIEISEYWNSILSRLVEIIKKNNEYSESAANGILDNLRSIIGARQGSIILPYIGKIAEIKNFDWDAGLRILKLTRKYEKNVMSQEMLQQVNAMIESLEKHDFNSKFVALSNWYYSDEDEIYSADKVKERFRQLAEEFITTEVSWEEVFPQLYSKPQSYSFEFGKSVYQLLKNNNEKLNHFITYSLEILSTIPKEERNPQVLGGFIAESTDDIKEQFYQKVYDSGDLNYLLFYFISSDAGGKKYFDLLFSLIDSNKCDLSLFNILTYGISLAHLNEDELLRFADRLFAYGDGGYTVVFDLFFDLGYRDDATRKFLLPIYKKCIYRLGINKEEQRPMDRFKWTQAITNILMNPGESEFAVFINHSVISSITWENSYHLDHDMQKIYGLLITIHFDSIWPELSLALLSKEEQYITFYGLKHILGSHIGGVGRSSGILFDGNINHIFKWCQEYQPLAPARLAELAPIFDNDNTDFSKWHPVTSRIIDEFGHIKEVLSSLSANMGTFSWTGSVVPMLEAKKELFKLLSNHEKPLVREWATSNIAYLEKEVEREKIRDAESFL